ncbi:MAG: 50S ribosomal protein L18 [Mycoplasmatales bacterium]
MIKKVDRNKARLKRHARARNKIAGTKDIPRLSIFRSNSAIYVQLIDDENGITLASCSSKELKATNNNIETCTKVGELIGDKAKEKKISKVVFDRSGYKYHGKIKALADAAREKGLEF